MTKSRETPLGTAESAELTEHFPRERRGDIWQCRENPDELHWVCTRPDGHEGIHVAHIHNGKAVAYWVRNG